jgi:hypothetical protein
VNRSRSDWLPGLLCLLFSCASSIQADPVIPSFEASYRIERSIFDIGRIQLQFYLSPAGNYVYNSITEVAGFIAWFRDDRVEETSRGRIDASGIYPDHYRFERIGGKGDRQAEVRFDWKTGQVENTVDGKSWEMAIAPGTLDKLVVQIAMMRNLQGSVQDQHFRVADGGKLKDFRIHVQRRETVEVPAGNFDTIKVEKTPEYGSRKTYLWLAPGLGYLPVQIMRIEEDGASYVSVLESASDSLRVE